MSFFLTASYYMSLLYEVVGVCWKGVIKGPSSGFSTELHKSLLHFALPAAHKTVNKI